MEQEFLTLLNSNTGIIVAACNFYAPTLERDDLMQEIKLQAWRGFNNWQKSSKFSTWLHSLCKNICIYESRKMRRHRNVIPLDEQIFNMPGNAYDVSAKIQEGMRYSTVLDSLDGIDQQVIQMYMDGASGEDISAATGITEINVRVKVNRIKKRLSLRYGVN